MFSKRVKHILLLLISMMVLFMMFHPAYAAVTHEGFSIISPVETETYPVNEEIPVTIKCEQFIKTIVNGFIASEYNFVLLEISKDGDVKYTERASFSAFDTGRTRNYVSFTPTETGTYTVRVGFSKYDRGSAAVGNNKVSDNNYIGSYQFEVVEAKPKEEEKTEDTAETKTTAEKKANPMTAKAKTKTVKVSFKTLKKKNVTIAAKKAFTVKNAVGKVTYKKVSGSNKITVSKAGKIKVKKKTKKGEYSIKVKVTAAGNNSYKSKSKTVKLTIKVK